ncbi:hypothetical protein T492DRAFT_957364, partial [Pavlovales sp. CCMP2436]
MPYLTHADAEVSKAVVAEAAARSKIAVTAPARKPRSARSRKRSATRRPSSAPPSDSSSSCSRGYAASRDPRARVGGTVAAPDPEIRPPTPPPPCSHLPQTTRACRSPLARPPKKGANKVGKEKSDKVPGPKQLKVWAEKHDVALVQYTLAAGYPRLSVTGGKGK